MSNKSRFTATEMIGVTKVQDIFLRDFNWIPRIQYVADYGIDMIVEMTQDNNPNGKLIAIQIKSGESYFKESTKNNIIFRTDSVHIDYWLNHSLPVLIILYNNNTDKTYWQIINKNTVVGTGKGYKIEIPKTNLLQKDSLNSISKSNEFAKPIQKFIEYSLYKPLMQKIKDGEKIVVELEEWVNKMSGKATIKIFHVLKERDDETYQERKEKLISENHFYGVASYMTLFKIFSWADFNIDMSSYEEFDDYDEDETPGYKTVFIEDYFHNYELPIIPYSSNGEVDYYRLVMTLNEAGESFLNLYNEFEYGKQLKLF